MTTDTTVQTVEIVLFKVKPGVSDDQLLAVADALQRDVEGFPAYISRRLLKGDDGQWVDMVDWSSLESALQASQVVMTRPSAQAFEALVEGESVRVYHLAPARVYTTSPART